MRYRGRKEGGGKKNFINDKEKEPGQRESERKKGAMRSTQVKINEPAMSEERK